jgi:hypothetical protein
LIRGQLADEDPQPKAVHLVRTCFLPSPPHLPKFKKERNENETFFEKPPCQAFSEREETKSTLAIGWSTGVVSFFPFFFATEDEVNSRTFGTLWSS